MFFGLCFILYFLKLSAGYGFYSKYFFIFCYSGQDMHLNPKLQGISLNNLKNINNFYLNPNAVSITWHHKRSLQHVIKNQPKYCTNDVSCETAEESLFITFKFFQIKQTFFCLPSALRITFKHQFSFDNIFRPQGLKASNYTAIKKLSWYNHKLSPFTTEHGTHWSISIF